MIELIALVLLVLRVGKILEAKGRKALHYQILTVALWFGGELLGAIVGFAIIVIIDPHDLVVFVLIVICVLSGAAAGGLASYLIARRVPPIIPAAVTSGPASADAVTASVS